MLEPWLVRFILGSAVPLSCGLLWWFPKYQVRKSGANDPYKNFELENEARKTLAEILGGIWLIFGVYGTWETLRLSRDAQVTDRLTKAFGQLADDHQEARLTAVYSLERVDQDSKRDHWTIMEVLTEVIRDRASEDRHIEELNAYPEEKKAWSLFRWPPPEVQAALTVIGRRKSRYRHGEEKRLDLREAILVGARLTGAHLEGANLAGSDFEGISLSDASEGKFPDVTDLSGAHLEDSILDGAIFGRSKLNGAHLDRSSLRGADLSKVTDLTQKQLDKACVGPATKPPPHLHRPQPCH